MPTPSTSGLPQPQEGTATATGTLVGAAAGAAAGAIAGPPGIVAGAVIGAIAGAATGKALVHHDAIQNAENARLDEEIGVTKGDLGAAKLLEPPEIDE